MRAAVGVQADVTILLASMASRCPCGLGGGLVVVKGARARVQGQEPGEPDILTIQSLHEKGGLIGRPAEIIGRGIGSGGGRPAGFFLPVRWRPRSGERHALTSVPLSAGCRLRPRRALRRKQGSDTEPRDEEWPARPSANPPGAACQSSPGFPFVGPVGLRLPWNVLRTSSPGFPPIRMGSSPPVHVREMGEKEVLC
jgi:hypothetical protein